MQSNVTFFQSTNCRNLNQTVTTMCLPPVVSCSAEPMGLLNYCDELWNCNKVCQTEAKYFMAFIDGDKIQIQTQFYDTDNGIGDMTTPYDLFFDEVMFCGNDNNYTNTSLFSSRKMMAFKNGKSYQIIEIDTSLFSDDVWNISFTKGDRTVCTQQFLRVDEACNEPSVKLRSGCKVVDCFGYCYGVPDFYIGDLIEYDNTLRFFGHLKETEFGTEIVEFGKNRKGVTSDSYLLNLTNRVPPFAKDIIAKQMFECGDVFVDDIEYEVGSFTVTKENLGHRTWKIQIPLSKECDKFDNGYC